MHAGSTDEYETDDHHFEGDGDSSEDELVVAKKQRVGVSSGTKKKRVVVAASAETKTNNDKNDNSDEDIIDSDDDDFLAPQNKKRSKKPYHSDDDDDSEEEETKSNNTNNKQGRRAALGKMNDNKASTKKSSDSSDSDDDSDSDDLGLGFGSKNESKAASDRKRAALMQMYPSSSDDDSDESSSGDISFGAKKRRKNNNSNKKPPAKAAASSSRSKAIALDDSSSDSHDSDSSECVDVTMSASTRSKTKSSAPAAAARASATTAAIDCMSSDSDSDIEIPPTTGGRSLRFTRANPRPLEQTTTTTYKTDKGAAIHHHDPSVRANSNATLEEAKRVRAALLQSQRYHAEDVNLPSLPSQVVPKKASPPAVLDLSSNNGDYESTTRVSSSTTRAVVNTTTTPAVSYNGPIITIYLRYRDDSSNKESKVSLKIKMDQPLQHLVDQFQQHHYGKITQMKFDGQNLNLTKTPSFYDMDDEDLVDVVVIANSHGIPFAAAAAAATTTAAATTAVVSSAPVLPPRREEQVIHVRGGAAAGTRNETYEMKKSDPLTKVVNAYCKQNQLSTVTLEYNGRKLDTTKSCAQLDIPNNAYLDAIVASGPSINLIFRVNGKSNETERISIRMKEAFQPAMETFAQRRNVGLSQCQFVFDGETLRPSTTPEHLDLEGDEIIDVKVTESAPAPPIRATTTQSTARAAASASTTASAAPVMITIETNRNQNNNSRQKKWKLHDTSLVTKLKTDYTKYYKSKGCKQVQFYFRNQLITNESQSLRDLGIRNGDMVYAMENGKAYK